jgi:hypothetical protein
MVVGFRATIERRVAVHVTEALRDNTGDAKDTARRTRDIVGRLKTLEAGVERLRRQQRLTPFRGDLTIHNAWARHDGVAAVFARYHLPHCDTCPVGVDETLAEAATGHGFPLDLLLADLDQLLFNTELSNA